MWVEIGESQLTNLTCARPQDAVVLRRRLRCVRNMIANDGRFDLLAQSMLAMVHLLEVLCCACCNSSRRNFFAGRMLSHSGVADELQP